MLNITIHITDESAEAAGFALDEVKELITGGFVSGARDGSFDFDVEEVQDED